jgi:hypothetical protein
MCGMEIVSSSSVLNWDQKNAIYSKSTVRQELVPTRKNVNMCKVTAIHPLFPPKYLLFSMLKFPSGPVF